MNDFGYDSVPDPGLPIERNQFALYPEPEGTLFYEPWCSDLEKSAIDYSIKQVFEHAGEGIFLEIGSFEGRSSVFIANQIEPEILVCVDTWQGGSSAPLEKQLYGSRDIYKIFRDNIARGTVGNVDVVRADCFEYISYLEKIEAKIRFVYVDGPHDYGSVYQTLERLIPLMADNGVLLGDDYEDFNEVFQAVNAFFDRDTLFHPKCGRMWQWVNWKGSN